MQRALDQFRANLARVRDLGGVHSSLVRSTTQALDLTDLLRAQIVLVISAFDTLIHEIARLGMLESAAGLRPVSEAFRRFQIPYDAVQLAAAGTTQTWLDTEIRRKHSFLSFQAPDKVAEAIRLVSQVSLWQEAGLRLSRPTADIKNELQLIVDRRNKIAHEADADPSFPGARWPIDSQMTNHAIDFIEKVGLAIFSAI